MDLRRSLYQVRGDDSTGAIRAHPLDPTKRSYKNIYTLHIDADATRERDLFWTLDARCCVVSARLADRLSGLRGVHLTPTEEYVFPMLGERVVDLG